MTIMFSETTYLYICRRCQIIYRFLDVLITLLHKNCNTKKRTKANDTPKRNSLYLVTKYISNGIIDTKKKSLKCEE